METTTSKIPVTNLQNAETVNMYENMGKAYLTMGGY